MSSTDLAARFAKTPLTDKQIAKHRALAKEDRNAYVTLVAAKDGFAKAAKSKALDLMSLFLELGISPDERCADKMAVLATPSALQSVVRTVTDEALRLEWVRRLLAAGAQPGRRHPDTRYVNPAVAASSLECPLEAALDAGQCDTIEAMLLHGVDEQARVSAAASTIYYLGDMTTVSAERREELLRAILRVIDGVDLDRAAWNGRTLLHHACARNELVAVQRLIERGANVNQPVERAFNNDAKPIIQGSTAVDIATALRAARLERGESRPDLDQLVAALVERGARPSGAARARPAFAAPIDALLGQLCGRAAVEAAFANLNVGAGSFPFGYLFALSKALPLPEALAPLAESDPLAYLLYKPRIAPSTTREPPEEEWTDVLARDAYVKKVWETLSDTTILSRWEGTVGRGDVLAYDRLPRVGDDAPLVLIRASTDRIEPLATCEELVERLATKLQASR